MLMAATRTALLHLILRAAQRTPARDQVESGRSLLGDQRLLSFARGLSLGALIGAAIAGSTIWGRFLASRRRGEER